MEKLKNIAKYFVKSRLFAGIVLNLIALVLILIKAASDNFLADSLTFSFQKKWDGFLLEVALFEIPAFLIITGWGILETILEARDKKKK